MIENLRTRLTVWYVSVLGAVLVAVCVSTYALLARTLHNRIDGNLRAVTGIAITSLSNDLAEGQTVQGAAASTAAELVSEQAMVAIYDGSGRLLAEAGRDDDLHVTLPPLDSIPRDDVLLYTAAEQDDADDRHRVAVRFARIAPVGAEYVILASSDLETTDEELQSLRTIFLSVVPAALVMAGFVGWFLARKSLAPVVLMAERARRMSVENLGGLLPVANPRDELGRLAETFNELLARLASSFAQQRQFMADASHELRTPVATARTAATVALQRPHRQEEDYRSTLEMVEQQTGRLARIVEDMFTLARADAGNYPLQRAPLYLDELVADVARAAQVLASEKDVTVQHSVADEAAFTGDEELLRRMIANLVENAVKHAPSGSSVQLELVRDADAYRITVTDTGAGIPAEVQPQIFERFYRGDSARRRDGDSGGAGLGLAIARWVARQHRGDVSLDRSAPGETTFKIQLPIRADA
jgi:two-component system OmpR family sensor kinase